MPIALFAALCFIAVFLPATLAVATGFQAREIGHGRHKPGFDQVTFGLIAAWLITQALAVALYAYGSANLGLSVFWIVIAHIIMSIVAFVVAIVTVYP